MTDHHDDPALMTGSHALNALTDEERRMLEQVLADSPELRAEADSLRETTVALAYGVEPIEPPASLKASLLAQIQSTPQVPAEPVVTVPAPSTSAASASEPWVPADGREAPLAPVTDVATAGGGAASAARRRWFQRPAAVLGAAAAVAVVFLGVGLGVGVATAPETGGPAATQAASRLDQIYAASDFQRKTAEVTGGGTATVVWSAQLGKSAVILDGVQAVPADKTYELWYIGSEESGSKIASAGLMDGVDGGVRSAVLKGTMAEGDAIGITVEPSGGSKQPTTTPIVAVPTA